MRWIYKIDNNGSLTTINPLNPRQFEVKKTLTDDSIYDWRTTIDGDFILMGADYLYMKTLERDFRHQKFAFKVYDNSSLIYTGEFTINDCSFDDYSKVVSVKHTMRDLYTQIQENEDVEFNIIGVSENITGDIYSYIAIELKTRDDTSPYSEPGDETYRKFLYKYEPIVQSPDYIYWAIYATELIIVPDTDIFSPGDYGFDTTPYVTLDKHKIYRRYPTGFNVSVAVYDTLRTLPTSSLIELVWDIYGNSISDDFLFMTEFIPSYSFHTWHQDTYKSLMFKNSKVYLRKTYYSGKFTNIYERTYTAYSLKSVLTGLVVNINDDFTDKIKSSLFFNDTPETGRSTITSLDNSVYLIDINDFKKSNAYEKTTIAKTTFSKLIKYICDKHNARWFIDSEGNFRIEHISYFETAQVGINKSSDAKIPLKYEYLRDKKPNREYIKEQYGWGEDFDQIEIVYGTVPAVNGIKESTNSISLSDFHTDIDGMNSHLGELSNEGFVYVMVSNGAISTGTGFKSELTDVQNAGLSNANCLNTYYRHDAYQDTFTIGGKSVTALSLKKMKVQKLEFMSDSVPDVSKKMETPVLTGVFKELSYNTVEEYKFKAELHE